jgi:hypothetical protein
MVILFKPGLNQTQSSSHLAHLIHLNQTRDVAQEDLAMAGHSLGQARRPSRPGQKNQTRPVRSVGAAPCTNLQADHAPLRIRWRNKKFPTPLDHHPLAWLGFAFSPRTGERGRRSAPDPLPFPLPLPAARSHQIRARAAPDSIAYLPIVRGAGCYRFDWIGLDPRAELCGSPIELPRAGGRIALGFRRARSPSGRAGGRVSPWRRRAASSGSRRSTTRSAR